jgi:2-polyprenyl-3-methyl-5-hydroxy-6-metoxy-1,4-benzoquinol methylase
MQIENLSSTRYVASANPDADVAVQHAARLIGRGKKVLEIGPATGILTRILVEELACDVVALEIDPAAGALVAKFCRAVHVADIETSDLARLLGTEKFDVITFGDVLEHLRVPAAALARVKPFLEPDGFLVVSVPNIAHASIAFELAHGRFSYRPIGLLDATHIHFFTGDSLLRTLDEAGLELETLFRHNKEPAQTEFATTATSSAQQALLNYIVNANPESRTYQFIAKAVPRRADEKYLPELTLPEAAARIGRLEVELEQTKRALNRTQSSLQWIEDKWLVRLLNRIKPSGGKGP